MIQVSMVWSGIFQTWRSKIIVGHCRGVTSESYQNWFTYSWSSPTLRMCTTHRWFTYAMPLCIIRHSDSKAFSQGMLNIIPQSQSKSHSSDLIILEEARAQKWIRRKLTRQMFLGRYHNCRPAMGAKFNNLMTVVNHQFPMMQRIQRDDYCKYHCDTNGQCCVMLRHLLQSQIVIGNAETL